MATKLRKGATNAGRVLAMTRANGEWIFIVQVFSTSGGDEPIVCQHKRLDELKGTPRKKAERWVSRLEPVQRQEGA